MYIRCSLAKHGITNIKDLWTKRNYIALSIFFNEIDNLSNSSLKSFFRFVATAIIPKTTRCTRYKYGGNHGPLTGTLYIPSLSVERNILGLAERKISDICRAYQSPDMTAFSNKTSSRFIFCNPAQSLDIPDNSIDYIFTDPPFGANIFYSDLNLLWEGWLGHYTNSKGEAVINRSKKPSLGGKTVTDYEKLMHQSFVEMKRVLKPNRWASVVFHNSDDKVWDAIRNAAESAGLLIVNAQAFDKVLKSFKGIRGEQGLENVSSLDIVLNLHKPSDDSLIDQVQMKTSADATIKSNINYSGNNPAENLEILTERIAITISHYLLNLSDQSNQHGSKNSGSRSSQSIFGHVIQDLITKGQSTTGVSFEFVHSILQDLFKLIDDDWYLMAEPVRANTSERSNIQNLWTQAFSTFNNEHELLDWLTSFIKNKGPQRESHLLEQFRLAGAKYKLNKDFRVLLSENFRQTTTNLWRLPRADELDAISDLRRKLVQRRCANILSHHQTSHDVKTLLSLIDDCFVSELYREVVDLFAITPLNNLNNDEKLHLQNLLKLARHRTKS